MDAEQDAVYRMTGWRVDKRIPVWGIIIGVGQGVIWGVIMYSTLYTSQMNLEKRISMLEANSVSNVNYAHLDEKMNGVQQSLADMKSDLAAMKMDVQRLTIRGR